MGLEKRREIVLTVEREVPGPDGSPRRVALSGRYDLSGRPEPPTPEELGEATRALDRELEAALSNSGFPIAPARRNREIGELVETYRPRQAELVDVLEADGELTHGEAELLRAHVASHPAREPPPIPGRPRPASEVPITDRPLAALPLANDRTPTAPRPVSELLVQYRIESLKQAGAVRARRQISFEEYMALKRHFAEQEARTTTARDAPPPTF